MRVNSVDSQYKTQMYEQMAKNAGVSAALSSGLTFAVNKGRSPKIALSTGLLAGGVSIAIDAISNIFSKNKS